jgi:hypothetical protein
LQLPVRKRSKQLPLSSLDVFIRRGGKQADCRALFPKKIVRRKQIDGVSEAYESLPSKAEYLSLFHTLIENKPPAGLAIKCLPEWSRYGYPCCHPVKLLTAALSNQVIKKMVVINISTVASLQQEQLQPPPPAPSVPPKTITFNGGGGGVENIPFLQANADAATVFATFWIEQIAGPTSADDFFQLQYVQTVFLNFPIIAPNKPPVPFTWLHVSVATLQKTFGGQ